MCEKVTTKHMQSSNKCKRIKFRYKAKESKQNQYCEEQLSVIDHNQKIIFQSQQFTGSFKNEIIVVDAATAGLYLNCVSHASLMSFGSWRKTQERVANVPYSPV